MKYGIVSDLHLGRYHPVADFNHLVDICNQADYDVLLIAGDLDEDPNMRNGFLASLKKPHLFIGGNHDYYWTGLTSDKYEALEYGVVAATLWTNFWGSPIASVQAQHHIPDFRNILRTTDPDEREFILPIDMERMFDEHLEFIEKSSAKVVMTHFPPHIGSLHPTMEGYSTNPYFVNRINEYRLEAMGKKLWVHGHTHNVFDYEVADMRVVCNPLGYPFDGVQKELYEVKVIEV